MGGIQYASGGGESLLQDGARRPRLGLCSLAPAAASVAVPTGPSPGKTGAKLWTCLGQLNSSAPSFELDKRFS